MYEPGNFVDSSVDTVPEKESPIYIHNDRPSALHIYCKDFTKHAQNITLYGGVEEVSTCPGKVKGTHTFLTYEGITQCKRCDTITCQYCNFGLIKETADVEHRYCLKCYLLDKVIPKFEIWNHIPFDQMTLRLHKVGIELNREENCDALLALMTILLSKRN